MSLEKKEKRLRRHRRLRKKVQGTSLRPRLNVFQSLKYIYAQIIDDEQGMTIASASTLSPELKARKLGKKTEEAKAVGELLAKKALTLGIQKVVFDRGGYRYHGRVKALAEGARVVGLSF